MPKNHDYDEVDDEDEDDDGEEYERSDISENVRKSCFDLLVASFITNILDDDTIDSDEQDRAEIIDQILTVLEDHLDDEGIEYLNESFFKFENQYNIQVQTEEIIQSLDWNQQSEE